MNNFDDMFIPISERVGATDVVPALRDALATLLHGYALAAQALADEGVSPAAQESVLAPLRAAADAAAETLTNAA